jgi:hypothetical protein
MPACQLKLHDDPQRCLDAPQIVVTKEANAFAETTRIDGGCLFSQHSGGTASDLNLGTKARRASCRRRWSYQQS